MTTIQLCQCGGINRNACSLRGMARPELGGLHINGDCLKRLERRWSRSGIKEGRAAFVEAHNA